MVLSMLGPIAVPDSYRSARAGSVPTTLWANARACLGTAGGAALATLFTWPPLLCLRRGAYRRGLKPAAVRPGSGYPGPVMPRSPVRRVQVADAVRGLLARDWYPAYFPGNSSLAFTEWMTFLQRQAARWPSGGRGGGRVEGERFHWRLYAAGSATRKRWSLAPLMTQTLPSDSQPALPPPLPEPCPSCGSEAMDRFCPECGEQRVSESDYLLRRFLANAVGELSNLDSRVFRSFRALIASPGHLTAEHIAGRRRPYVGPLRLFLICNVLFFAFHIVVPHGTFTNSLSDHLHHNRYSSWVYGLSTADGVPFRELESDRDAYEAYAERFRATTTNLARSLVILLVPLVAVLTYVIFGRSRRYFAEHLVFALHFIGFVMLAVSATVLLVGAVMWSVETLLQESDTLTWQTWDSLFGLLLLSMLLPYLLVGSWRVFAESRFRTLVKVALLVVLLPLVLTAYRFILFFATVYTL